MKMKQNQRAWKVEIEAKANNGLAFGLKATKALPPPATAAARKLLRFSLHLKLSSVVIHIKSKYKPSVWPNPFKFFKSRFVPKFGDKFRRRTAPAAARTALNIPPPPRWKAMTIIIKGWDCCGGGGSSTLLRNLDLLRQWISQKDQNGTVLLHLVVNVSGWTGPIRYVASSVFKNNAGFGRKLMSILLVLFLLLVTAFCPSLRCASVLRSGIGIIQSLGIRIKPFQLNIN